MPGKKISPNDNRLRIPSLHGNMVLADGEAAFRARVEKCKEYPAHLVVKGKVVNPKTGKKVSAKRLVGLRILARACNIEIPDNLQDPSDNRRSGSIASSISNALMSPIKYLRSKMSAPKQQDASFVQTNNTNTNTNTDGTIMQQWDLRPYLAQASDDQICYTEVAKHFLIAKDPESARYLCHYAHQIRESSVLLAVLDTVTGIFTPNPYSCMFIEHRIGEHDDNSALYGICYNDNFYYLESVRNSTQDQIEYRFYSHGLQRELKRFASNDAKVSIDILNSLSALSLSTFKGFKSSNSTKPPPPFTMERNSKALEDDVAAKYKSSFRMVTEVSDKDSRNLYNAITCIEPTYLVLQADNKVEVEVFKFDIIAALKRKTYTWLTGGSNVSVCFTTPDENGILQLYVALYNGGVASVTDYYDTHNQEYVPCQVHTTASDPVKRYPTVHAYLKEINALACDTLYELIHEAKNPFSKYFDM